MLKQHTCHVCRSRDLTSTDLLISGKFPLMHCNNCGLSFLDIDDAASQDEIVDEYWTDENKAIYAQPRVVKELRDKYQFYFSILANKANGNRHLDVGSGAGICVDTARQMGFDSMGVEPSTSGVALAKDTYQIKVVNALLSKDDDLPRDFDVLTLWDVIEHVPSPRELVSIISDHLSSGGILALETPDEGAFARKLVLFFNRYLKFPDFRRNMYYRAHRYYFTRRAMEIMLNDCGFKEVEFYKERSMYEKAKMKLDLYFTNAPKFKKMTRKILFWLMKRLPFTKNKMVVIARKV